MKNFLFLLHSIILLGLISCGSESKKTKIRIVDLQGKPKPVLTKVPEYNAKLLDGQQYNNSSNANASVEQQATTIAPENKITYNNSSNQAVVDTINTPINEKSKPKINDAFNDNPDKTNMIFAGRSKSQDSEEFNLANSKDEVEEVELNSNNQSASAKKNDVVKKATSDNKKLNSTKLYFVQTGSYIAKDIADEELKLMKKFYKGKIEKVQISEDKITYRVLLGPFTSKPQARKMVNKIVNSGHEAILVKNQ